MPAAGSTRRELYLFCGDVGVAGGTRTAAECAEQMMRLGYPSMVLPLGADPYLIAWPMVAQVAIFSHESLDDAQVRALAEALIYSGIDYVFVSGNRERKRGPVTYGAVA